MVPVGPVVPLGAIVGGVSVGGHYMVCIVRGYFDPAFLQVHLMRRTGT